MPETSQQVFASPLYTIQISLSTLCLGYRGCSFYSPSLHAVIPQERPGDTEIKQQIRVNEVGYPSFCTLVSSLRRCMMDYYDGKRRNVNSALSIYTERKRPSRSDVDSTGSMSVRRESFRCGLLERFVDI